MNAQHLIPDLSKIWILLVQLYDYEPNNFQLHVGKKYMSLAQRICHLILGARAMFKVEWKRLNEFTPKCMSVTKLILEVQVLECLVVKIENKLLMQ